MAFGEYFMTRPPSEVEPALAWGGNRVVLEMIGGPYAFSGLSVQQSRWVREHLETLCNNSTACTPASETEVCRTSEDLFKPIDVRGWEYTYERDYQLDHVSLAGLCFSVGSLFDPPAAGAYGPVRRPLRTSKEFSRTSCAFWSPTGSPQGEAYSCTVRRLRRGGVRSSLRETREQANQPRQSSLWMRDGKCFPMT